MKQKRLSRKGKLAETAKTDEPTEPFPLLSKKQIGDTKSRLSQGILKGRLVWCCSCSSLGQNRGMKAVMRMCLRTSLLQIDVKICVTGCACVSVSCAKVTEGYDLLCFLIKTLIISVIHLTFIGILGFFTEILSQH